MKYALLIIGLLIPEIASSYPIDGYFYTGIRRLVRLVKISNGEIAERPLLAGQTLPLDSIRLHLAGKNDKMGNDELFHKNSEFQKKLDALFPNLHESYAIALLDFSPGKEPRFASRQENRGFQPGSVGKLAVVTGIYCELESLFPDDFEKRIELLRSKVVKAGKWAIPNIHTVPFYDPGTGKFEKRILRESDKFSLFEWIDHMLSVSSNGAASVVWRETILMREFGGRYPTLTDEEITKFFKETPQKQLSDMSVSVVNDPLRDLGIGDDEWRLGTMFTRGASSIVPPQGGSIGTVKGMMKWLVALEKGEVIDERSSLEIKRLMYMTDRRIRYAANASLNEAAVYFKSGSLYQCVTEDGFVCEKYKGNKNNFMNSVAIIEHGKESFYLVVLMSNVLKKNSNVDHNTLAGRIDKLVVG